MGGPRRQNNGIILERQETQRVVHINGGKYLRRLQIQRCGQMERWKEKRNQGTITYRAAELTRRWIV